MILGWQLRAFRWIFSAFLVFASVKVFLAGVAGVHEGPHGPRVLVILASAEIAAAIAFLIEPIELVALAALLAVFAAAAALSAITGDILPLRFVYYGATALFIVAARRRSALTA
jgi:hypothetical protein